MYDQFAGCIRLLQHDTAHLAAAAFIAITRFLWRTLHVERLQHGGDVMHFMWVCKLMMEALRQPDEQQASWYRSHTQLASSCT